MVIHVDHVAMIYYNFGDMVMIFFLGPTFIYQLSVVTAMVPLTTSTPVTCC